MSQTTHWHVRPRQAFRRLTGLLAGAVGLAGCSGAVGGPSDAVTFELRAVNGVALPFTRTVIGDDTLRILGERVTLGSNGRAEALRLQQFGRRPPTVETIGFVVRSAGDSVRFVFPCPANARCSVSNRVGVRAIEGALQLREETLSGLTLDYVRLE